MKLLQKASWLLGLTLIPLITALPGTAQAQCEFPYYEVCGEDCCPNPSLTLDDPEFYPDFCFSIPPSVTLGVNLHRQTDPAVLNLAKEMNLRWVRVDLNWKDMEPKRGVYKWEITKAMVEKYSRHGFEILGLIHGIPDWALFYHPRDSRKEDDHRSHRDDPEPSINRTDFQAIQPFWEKFVAEIVKEHPQVRYWEPWNEPNRTNFFPGNFEKYFYHILKPAAEQVKFHCPDCRIVGPTVSDQIDDKNKWTIGQFFNLLGAHQGAQYIDVVSINHYRSSEYSDLVQRWHSRFATFDRNGFGGKPVWITETGAATSPLRQARYLLQMITFMSETPGIENLFIYELEGDSFGLIDSSGLPKEAYYMLRDIYEPRCVPPGYPWD